VTSTDDSNRETSTLGEAALRYVEQGGAIAPLHRIDSGLCTCGNPDVEHTRRQGGKHPIHANWQIAALRDAAAVAAYWTAHPRANVGLATGAPSGVWVLDVDPEHGGDVALQALIETYGPLPPTRKHQTGSGGCHFLWRMPADFELTNRRGQLPVGLDVRGTGGQIVMPPSVSGKGGYFVLSDAEPVDAPAWLLDLIRPAPYGDTGPVTLECSNNPRGFLNGGIDATRAHAYAVRAMAERCAELARAPEGMRNETAFSTACRLWELVNAGWVPADGAHARYVEACDLADSAAGAGSRFPPNEAESVWTKAWRRVSGGRAELPPDGMHGEALPFAGVPGAVSMPTPAPGSMFVDPAAPGVAGVAVDVARVAPDVASPAQATLERLRARLRTGAEFAALPPPQPLVAGLLDRDSIAWMIGKSGSYKSFVTLDIAAHIATGQRWRGRYTHVGPVVYVCAEGQAGAHLRIGAWMRQHGRQDTGELLVLDVPVQARVAAEWDALVQLCQETGPVLIVIDTQARCALGFEENSNSDMSLFVGKIDRLREATGACVLVVHHIGRNGSNARGASVIDGAQDAELRVERADSPLTCTVSTDKQKDRPDDIEIALKLDVVRMGWSPLTGEDITSLVVSDAVPQMLDESEALSVDTSHRGGQLADVVARHFATGNGGTKSEILRVLDERYGKADRSTNYRAWAKCLDEQVFERVAGLQSFRYVPVDNRAKGDEERTLLERVDAVLPPQTD
jgi:hypothetical protein